jgi:Mn2+/Fe2+ NRAMP family transporter
MKRSFAYICILISSTALPVAAFAQGQETFKNIVIDIVDLIGGSVMPLLFLAALTWFIWGVVEFIRNSDNQEKRKQGRRRMLWGIVALFVMVSYLGITSVFTETLFNRQPILPQLYEEAN